MLSSKNFLLTLCATVALSATTALTTSLDGDGAARPTAAAASAATAAINYQPLAEQFPPFFNGFQFPPEVAAPFRGHQREAFVPNPDFVPHFEKLLQILTQRNHPGTEMIRQVITEVLSDPARQNNVHFLYCVGMATMAISPKLENEQTFFDLTKVNKIFRLLGKVDPSATFHKQIAELERVYSLDKEDGETLKTKMSDWFSTQQFPDPHHVMRATFDRNPFKSVPYFVLAEKPGEDIFGLYYLALMYYKGIHPIPVTFEELTKEEALADPILSALHGAIRTAWAKLLHDWAHHEADQSNDSMKGFGNRIMNLYKIALEQNVGAQKTPEDQARYDAEKSFMALQTVMPHVANFASTVHEAYRQSLVNILEASLRLYPSDAQATSLPKELSAFCAGAFIHAHEKGENMAKRYATPNLVDLLAAQKTVPVTPSAEAGAAEAGAAEAGAAEVVNKEKIDNLFHTSVLTGESSLSDDEIVAAVRNLPMTDFIPQHHWYTVPSDETMTFKPDEIITVKVKARTPNYIDVLLTTMSGGEYLYRQLTNLDVRLNLLHDLHLLQPARDILSEKYDYALPVIPQEADFLGNETEFSTAVFATVEALKTGMGHLRDYHREFSSHIATTEGIAERFRGTYETALAELQAHMPAFIGDVQAFVTQAMTDNLYSYVLPVAAPVVAEVGALVVAEPAAEGL